MQALIVADEDDWPKELYDVASAGLARGLDRPEGDGASHASAAELLKRIHILDLSARTVDVGLAVAGELAAQPDGEEPRSDHSLVLPMLLREQLDDFVRSELGLAPIHLMDEVLDLGERDLLDGQV